jgi:hypothetical protein
MAAPKKTKKGSVLNQWIVEEEVTPAGRGPNGMGSYVAVRIKREGLSGFVISNLHFPAERYAITGEPGEWDLKKVLSVDWSTINGTAERRRYLLGSTLRSSETILPLVEGL